MIEASSFITLGMDDRKCRFLALFSEPRHNVAGKRMENLTYQTVVYSDWTSQYKVKADAAVINFN